MKDGYLVKPTLASIPDKQLDMLHEAALKILADTGLNVHSAEVRSMLRKGGAQVKDDLRVYIPAELVNQSLATAPSRVDIYDRTGEVAMVLEGQRSYFGTGSDLKFTIDLETQQQRESTLRDVELSARLCDRLEGIDFVMSHALALRFENSSGKRQKILHFNIDAPLRMTRLLRPARKL